MSARRIHSASDSDKPVRRKASTPQARENQLIDLAVDAAEELMRSGNAPAQVITHYLKLGSSREKIEQERIRADVEIANAKIDAMKSVVKAEELFQGAITAMTKYRGEITVEDVEFYDD